MTGPDGDQPAPTLVPDALLRTQAHGRVLLGGTPFRVMKLSASGADRVRSWFTGKSEPASEAEKDLATRLVGAGLAHPRPVPASLPCHAVIPFRGRLAEIEATLAPLFNSHLASITVVDDGSTPPLPPIDGATVLRHDRSAGPAAARNTGWRHVARVAEPSDAIAFIDGGVVPPAKPGAQGDPGWLETLLGHLTDGAVAAVAPRVTSVHGTRLIERYEEMFSPLDLGPTPSLVGPGRRVTYVPTACLVVRLEDLESTNGFDEELRYGEDVDLVWRLATVRQVRYDPSVVVHHPPRVSVRAFIEQRYRYASAAAALDRRHASVSAPWQTSMVGLAGVVVTSLGHPTLGALVGFGPTKLLARTLSGTATPTATSVRLLGESHWWALRSFAECVGRTWAPLAIVGSLAPVTPSRWRRATLGWAIAGWARRLSRTRSLPLLALGVADDVSYGAGAFAGAVRHRSPRSLLPKISRWG